MKKRYPKALALALAFILSFASLVGFTPATAYEEAPDLTGTTVIIYTGNIRGDITVLPAIGALRHMYAAKGAQVILVDTGNYLQGSIYAAYDQGRMVIELMQQTGYDLVAIGSREFDFGTGTVGVEFHGIIYEDDSLGYLLEDIGLTAVAANITAGEEALYAFGAYALVDLEDDRRIGFFGLTDPATVNQVLESNLEGLTFESPQASALAQVEALAEETDLIIGLSNLGRTLFVPGAIMLDVYAGQGLTVGVVIIDDETNAIKSHSLVQLPTAEDIEALALAILEQEEQEELEAQERAALEAEQEAEDEDEEDAADAEYEEYDALSAPAPLSLPTLLEAVEYARATAREEFPVYATSTVTLEGAQHAVRSRETNIGNLWTDALRWFAIDGGMVDFFDEDDIDAGNYRLQVEPDYVVAIWNGGNLRDYLNTGHVTRRDLQRVLPFPNRVAVMYLTGYQLLEMLEAATQALGTDHFSANAAFPHVSGIQFTVDTTVEFDAGEAHGNHWYRANSIGRVSIQSINGHDFNGEATYAIITSNAIFNGMDSNYISLYRDEEFSTITNAMVIDAVWMFILEEMGGTISLRYLTTEGRITIIE